MTSRGEIGKIEKTVSVKKIMITILTKVKKLVENEFEKSMALGITSWYGFVINISPGTKNGQEKPVITN